MPWKRARDRIRGPSTVECADTGIQRLNLSFVLHESSTSPAVSNMLARAPVTRASELGLSLGRRLLAVNELARHAPELVVTAHVGSPAILGDAAARLPRPPAIIAVEAVDTATTEFNFFRAPARLSLPTWSSARAVAAAAINRPGAQSVEIICSACYRWPDQRDDLLRELARIVLAHVDQWRAPRALWDGPAEILLPEVLRDTSSGPRDTG